MCWHWRWPGSTPHLRSCPAAQSHRHLLLAWRRIRPPGRQPSLYLGRCQGTCAHRRWWPCRRYSPGDELSPTCRPPAPPAHRLRSVARRWSSRTGALSGRRTSLCAACSLFSGPRCSPGSRPRHSLHSPPSPLAAARLQHRRPRRRLPWPPHPRGTRRHPLALLVAGRHPGGRWATSWSRARWARARRHSPPPSRIGGIAAALSRAGHRTRCPH
mmetsp:Transcript_51392/g.132608  ORF Transcript_51392/g.132608 Transcript_51392/m.132608 type:complete len:214 (-) Transcript_51392:951-1592(-)